VYADQTQDINETSTLKKLSLRGVGLYSGHFSGLISPQCVPRLREVEALSFVSATDCNDDFVASLGRAFPTLRELDISGTDVTGVGVKDLVHSGSIRKLSLNDCRKLGIDAVEWARSQGVEVKYKMKNVEGGGKKVRY
jgi:F-box/TPR repeat protein Pof3